MRWLSMTACVVLSVAVSASGQTTRPAAKGASPAAAGTAAGTSKRAIGLYDTLSSARLAETAASLPAEGWKRIEPGQTPASFQGDAALVNDKLAVVVGKADGGVELYARGESGWTRRGRLAAMAADSELNIEGLKPAPAGRLEAAVEARLGADRGLLLSMTAASPILKVTATGKVDALRIKAPCRFGVLPDFFADDLMVDGQAIAIDRAEVPSDNFFLHMLGAGEAILAAVWEENVRDVRLTLAGQGPDRLIVASDVFFGEAGNGIFAAVLEAKGIWHGAGLNRDDGIKGRKLDGWDVPFLAKWKGNFTREDGTVESAPFSPVGGGFSGAWEQHKLEPSPGKRGLYAASLMPSYHGKMPEYVGYNGPMVAYPIGRLADRPQERAAGTPLDRLCIDDLLRQCLGTEACAYVLDVDARQPEKRGIFTCSYGKTAGVPVPPTPRVFTNEEAARAWKEDRAFMKRQTQDVLVFIKHIQDRINTFLDMREALLAYLDEAAKKYPGQAEFVGRLKTEMNKQTRVFSRFQKIDVRANGDEVARPMLAEMLKALKVDTPEQAAKAWRAGGVAGAVGDPQDERLQRLRRQVKLWRAMATMEMARNPEAAEIAKEVRKRTEAALRNVAHYEKETVW